MSHAHRKIIHTTKAPAPIGPYSQAIEQGQMIFTSGQIALDPVSGELRDDIDAQINQVFANLKAVLDSAGAGFADVVKFTIFLTDLADFPKVNTAMEKHCSAPYPARSTVQVAALPKGAKVEIECVAIRQACC